MANEASLVIPNIYNIFYMLIAEVLVEDKVFEALLTLNLAASVTIM